MKMTRRTALKGMAAATLAANYCVLTNKPASAASVEALEGTFRALRAKIYSLMTHTDRGFESTAEDIVSWMVPAITFDNSGFDFATKGLAGRDRNETNQLLHQANQFSQIVNSVPTSNSEIYQPFSEKLWNSYGRVLSTIQCANGALSAGQKAKLDKFWKLRFSLKEVIDIQTDQVSVLSQVGPVSKAFENSKALYEASLLGYNNAKVSALNDDLSSAVQTFALNGELYRSRVRAASQQWVSAGYKNEIEQIKSFVDQVSKTNLLDQKTKMIEQFNRGKLNDPIARSEFYLTKPVLTEILTGNSKQHWTNITFEESNIGSYSRKNTNAWRTNDRSHFGQFSVRSNRGDIENFSEIDTSGFQISFDIAQVNLSRPWFDPNFFGMRSWKFSNPSTPPLSDGRRPPQGSLIGFPTSCIFAKNVKIDFAELHKPNSSFVRSLKSSRQARFGIFMSGQSFYPDSPNAKPTHRILNDGSLEISGLQLIALRSHALGQSPNPDPAIRNWR